MKREDEETSKDRHDGEESSGKKMMKRKRGATISGLGRTNTKFKGRKPPQFVFVFFANTV